MKSNYDRVAPFYDRLSRLVYGNAILQAHRFLVNAIPANSSVLIAGGGTGYILEEISKKHVSGLHITYVENSEKMMAFSKRRNTGNNDVVFVHQSIGDVVLPPLFDVVITPFLFDNFTDSTGKIIFDKTDSLLIIGGLWMMADFQISEKNKLWQKLLLKLMYLFFRVCCNIEASHLTNLKLLFKKDVYQPVLIRTFYKNFIYAAIYSKKQKSFNN